MVKSISKRKERIGVVISDKMKKTIIVRVERFMRHASYGKIIKRFNKFKVHDEKNIAKVRDIVMIQETRPLSKEKRWRLVQVIKRAPTQQITSQPK